MYIKVFAIPCYDRSGDFMDNFWRFEKIAGQTKGQDWVELTGLRTDNERDMQNMRHILKMKKDLLLDTQNKCFQKMHDNAVCRAMRRAERLMKWENGLKRSSL